MCTPSDQSPVSDDAFQAFDRALGTFTRKFEHLMGMLRLIIKVCFRKCGLTKGPLIEVVLADIFASHLRKLVAPIYERACPQDFAGLEVLKKVLSKVEKMIEARNYFSHNLYFRQEETPGSVFAIKYYRRGLEGFHHDEEDLQSCISFIRILHDALQGAITHIENEESIETPLQEGLRNLPDSFPSYQEPIDWFAAFREEKTEKKE